MQLNVNVKKIFYDDETIDLFLRITNETPPSVGVNISSDFIKFKYDDVFKLIEDSLRTKATPIIKGKITKNKIKYRGIKLMTILYEDYSREYWMTQRGESISEIILKEDNCLWKHGISDLPRIVKL